MTESSTGNVDKTWLVPRKVTKLQSFSKSSWNIPLAMFLSASTFLLPSSRDFFIAICKNLSCSSKSLDFCFGGKNFVSLVIGVESESLYSKSTHFDSALAADLHEKSLGIFSSHAGAIAGAGHLWEHKPNLKQDVKAVSQMTANPARSPARNLTTLLSFSQCARIVCLAIAFLGKCVGVTFI